MVVGLDSEKRGIIGTSGGIIRPDKPIPFTLRPVAHAYLH
jgi:hypothetical protein